MCRDANPDPTLAQLCSSHPSLQPSPSCFTSSISKKRAQRDWKRHSSRKPTVRIVQVESSEVMVKTDAFNFKSIVQKLTGNNFAPTQRVRMFDCPDSSAFSDHLQDEKHGRHKHLEHSTSLANFSMCASEAYMTSAGNSNFRPLTSSSADNSSDTSLGDDDSPVFSSQLEAKIHEEIDQSRISDADSSFDTSEMDMWAVLAWSDPLPDITMIPPLFSNFT
ncbi:hypothetical protein KP509_04G049800 [Ceratopteris richardii]|uniref:VQ domain-containing protein n=1 Tax=Ceratopteris richardii TaxID=49495 RepID=A0A8T2USK0_CERRI|nr:hypothetical protein KP509_04G049800 [Ceratopteris richardii]